MKNLIENIRTTGNELEDVKSEIQSLESILRMIKSGKPYNAVCEIRFLGMYARSSSRVFLNDPEVTDIINSRLKPLNEKRDILITKLNSFL